MARSLGALCQLLSPARQEHDHHTSEHRPPANAGFRLYQRARFSRYDVASMSPPDPGET